MLCTALIYCDEAFQYIGHRNAVFLMPSLDAVHRNTPFRVMHPFNTMETEMLYIHIHIIMSSLDVVQRHTTFIVMQPFNM